MPKKSKVTRKTRLQSEIRKLEKVSLLENGNTRVENLVKVGSKWEWSLVEVNQKGDIMDCNEVFRKLIKIGTRNGQEQMRKHMNND